MYSFNATRSDGYIVTILYYYLHVCTLFLVLSAVQQTKVSWSVRKAALWRSSLFQKFGNGMLYCLEAPIRKFQNVSMPIWRHFRRFELNESSGDYEGTASWKLRSDRSDKKRTPEFVEDINAINDNDTFKSTRFITRDMEVSEFLIRLVVHKDIHSVLLIENEKRANFYHRPWRTSGKIALQSFWTNIPSNRTCFGFFFQTRSISVRIRWWNHWTTVGLIYHQKMYLYWWIQNTLSTSWCLRWSLAMVTLCHYLSPKMAYIKCL